MMKRDKKEEEEGGNPFYNLEKSSVLQEARVFNETPINSRRCCHILTKILYLLNQGEHIGTNEATEAFFAMTKLFQSKDVTLRRMVYLCIKEMAHIAEDVIIVTSSLTKDMTGKEDQFRGPSIRALCRITDSTMLQSIERYMKQAIVDKVHGVSSAALVSSLHLGKTSPEVVKRWVNEAQEAVNSDNIMVQYHALGLLYHIRKSDKLAVTKQVQKYTRHSLKSPYAHCLLIRIACKLLEEENAGSDSPMFEFIESCLRHKSEMVIYEAAHAIVSMKHTTAKELSPAVSVLQLFCSSPKPTLRFAAVRTLNKVAMKHPGAVTACNLDLENLITDVNRSIATLAITTLLKTGSESSVDRLMKQISSFMSEISDEFKIVVVQAISSLCLKFPRKHGVMMSFLSSMLRDEGGFEYKRAIVDTIITIIEENGEGKEAGLAHLCEFIEDCEHTVLATRILHLLGREGPRTPQPAKYIRFIYNRVILEDAAVRAAAVCALAKFGAHCEELLPSITVLLQRVQLDMDDEVRDRATFYLNVLNQTQKALNSAFILNSLQVSIVGLERALHNYTMEPSETPFDLKSVPLATQPLTEHKAATAGEVAGPKAAEKVAASRQDVYAEQLSSVPELANLGPLFKSSYLPVELTESETEYVVRCVKHTFPHHMVFQFDCTNTLNDQCLEKVTVQMENAEGFEVIRYVPIASLPYDKPATTYTLVHLPDDPTQVTGTLSCTLKFVVKDCDPNTGEVDDEGYEDEYVLEDVELTVADHVQRVMKPNFAGSWEEVGESNELEDTYSLSSMKSLEGGNPLYNLEKSFDLQENWEYQGTPINSKRCCHILANILYLNNQGEGIGTNEATEAFFAVTKLFQSKGGGFEYKHDIVDNIKTIIEENGKGKEAGLAHLCEFIDDLEPEDLAKHILELLKKEGTQWYIDIKQDSSPATLLNGDLSYELAPTPRSRAVQEEGDFKYGIWDITKIFCDKAQQFDSFIAHVATNEPLSHTRPSSVKLLWNDKGENDEIQELPSLHLTNVNAEIRPPRPAGDHDKPTEDAIGKKLKHYNRSDRDNQRDQWGLGKKEFVTYILTISEKQEGRCEDCHVELKFEHERGDPNQFSVDRLDNSRGHVRGNIRLTCLKCNTNRGIVHINVWRQFCEKLYPERAI